MKEFNPEIRNRIPLLFDLDGTLWDAREGIVESWNTTFRKNGEPETVTIETLTPLLGQTTQAFADAFLPIEDKERQSQIMDEVSRRENADLERNKKYHLYPEVIETLRELSKTHWIGIVSNCEIGYIDIFVKAAHLEEVIDGYLCFGDTKMPKSFTIRKLMKDNHLANGIYFGDTQGDKNAAQDAGLPFIWVKYGFGQNVESKGLSSISDLVRDSQWTARIDQPLKTTE